VNGLDGSAARAAKMRAGVGRRAASAAESSGVHGHVVHRPGSVCGTGPDARGHPADQGPTEKEIQEEDACGVGLVSTKNRRQEVQER